METIDWAERLQGHVAAMYPEYAGQALTLRPGGKPQTFTRSRLCRLDVLADGQVVRRIAVKEPVGANSSDPAAEFAALQRLHAHFAGHQLLRVPRPLLVSTTPPALITEIAEGKKYAILLHVNRRLLLQSSMKPCINYTHLIGGWLACLHTLPEVERPCDVRGLWAQIDASIYRLRDAGAGIDSEIPTRIYRLVSDNNDAGLKSVVLHGDFTPRNILCQMDGGVTVLDTELSLCGPAEYDVGYFLASLFFIDRWQLLTQGRIYNERALDDVRATFIRAYERERGPLSPSLLAGYTALRLLSRWAEYAEHLRRTQPMAARLLLPTIVNPYFASVITAHLK